MIALDDRTIITGDWLCQELRSIRSTDVFCDEFLHGVIFVGGEDNAEIQIAPDAHQLLDGMGTSWIETLTGVNEGGQLKQGSYLALQQELLEIFRLYDDVQNAFMSSVILQGQA